MCNVYIKMFSLQDAETLCVLAGVKVRQSEILRLFFSFSLLLFVLDTSGQIPWWLVAIQLNSACIVSLFLYFIKKII